MNFLRVKAWNRSHTFDVETEDQRSSIPISKGGDGFQERVRKAVAGTDHFIMLRVRSKDSHSFNRVLNRGREKVHVGSLGRFQCIGRVLN